MFGNVRACTLECIGLRDDRRWRCPWLLLWFHHFWWNDSSVRWPSHRSKPPTETWLKISSRVQNGGYETAERSHRCFPCSLGTHSAVEFCGLVEEWNRRSCDFRGKFVFSPALFLVSINTSLSLVQNTSLLILRTLERYLERLERKSLKITSLILSTHVHMHKSSSKHHLGLSSIC